MNLRVPLSSGLPRRFLLPDLGKDGVNGGMNFGPGRPSRPGPVQFFAAGPHSGTDTHDAATFGHRCPNTQGRGGKSQAAGRGVLPAG